jgi:hypothetical protein
MTSKLKWRTGNPACPDRQNCLSSTWRIVVPTLIAIAMPVIANACPVCFGNPNSPLSKGATNGVLFLLGIIGIVQIGFVALFITFWRRARAVKKFREQFQVIEGGVR